MCNSIHELLNVFEDPAQRVHTIGLTNRDLNSSKFPIMQHHFAITYRKCEHISACVTVMD